MNTEKRIIEALEAICEEKFVKFITEFYELRKNNNLNIVMVDNKLRDLLLKYELIENNVDNLPYFQQEYVFVTLLPYRIMGDNFSRIICKKIQIDIFVLREEYQEKFKLI